MVRVGPEKNGPAMCSVDYVQRAMNSPSYKFHPWCRCGCGCGANGAQAAGNAVATCTIY